MIKAISNTSPIIGLSMIGHLELLWKLFDVYIPQEVYNEVVVESSGNAIGKPEIGAKIVIIDEKSARNFAEVLMLKPLGTLGILKLAKAKGKIEDLKPLLDLLVLNKFRISSKMINQLLRKVGE